MPCEVLNSGVTCSNIYKKMTSVKESEEQYANARSKRKRVDEGNLINPNIPTTNKYDVLNTLTSTDEEMEDCSPPKDKTTKMKIPPIVITERIDNYSSYINNLVHKYTTSEVNLSYSSGKLTVHPTI